MQGKVTAQSNDSFMPKGGGEEEQLFLVAGAMRLWEGGHKMAGGPKHLRTLIL